MDGKVLVVNDEPDVARLLALELSSSGVGNVLTCGSAEEALGVLERLKPAVVISDIHMGGSTGFSSAES